MTARPRSTSRQRIIRDGELELADSRGRRWLEEFDSQGEPFCIWRVKGIEHDHDKDDCRPPDSDHVSIWRHRKTGQMVFVSQPYHCDWDDLLEIWDFALKHGFHVEVSAWLSWHLPGSTMLIAWTHKEPLTTPIAN